MKKSIKRMLTTALAIAMMVTMIAIPVSAYPTDTKTFVLMNDDMSSAINCYHHDKTEANASYANFYAGKQWSQPWDNTPASFAVDNGDVAFYANAATRTNDQAIKGVFRDAPVVGDAKVSSVTMTYDVKTGSRTTNPVVIYTTIDTGAGDYRYVHDSNDDIISRYNSSTGQFFHGGWHNYNVTLSENTEYKIEYKFNYDGGKKNHMLSIVITDKAGNTSITKGEEQVETATLDEWDFYKKDIKTLTAIGYMLSCTAAAEADAGKEVFRIQNIKIENTVKGDVINFGDVAYNNYGVQLTGVNQADLDGVVAADSAAGLAGYQWAATNMNNLSSSFAIDGADLAAKSKTNSLKKKFAPINDGDTLKVSFTFKPYEYSGHSSNWDDATTLCYGDLSAIKLVGDTTNLAMFAKWRNQYNAGYLFLHEGIAQKATTNYKNQSDTTVRIQGRGNHNWYETNNGTSYITVDQQGSYLDSGDRANCPDEDEWHFFQNYTTCVLTAAPNADGATYDITMTIKNQSAWRADFVATKNVPKEKILDIDALEIVTVNTEGDESPGLDRPLAKYNNISVETINANAKTALADGENTVYLPVENVTGHAVDYAIVAAVYETGNDIPTDFAVATYTGHQKAADKLAINGVTISDTDTEYVVCYVFDKFDSLAPHTKPISSVDEDAE